MNKFFLPVVTLYLLIIISESATVITQKTETYYGTTADWVQYTHGISVDIVVPCEFNS